MKIMLISLIQAEYIFCFELALRDTKTNFARTFNNGYPNKPLVFMVVLKVRNNVTFS